MAIDFEKLKANAQKKDDATYKAASADFAKAKSSANITTPKTTSPSMTNRKSALSLLDAPVKIGATKGNLMENVQNRLATAPQIAKAPTAQEIATFKANQPKAMTPQNMVDYTNKIAKGNIESLGGNANPTTLERIAGTVSGATKDFAGTTINAIDWASKVPATPLWMLKKYNDLFVPDALGKASDKLIDSGAQDRETANLGASGAGKIAMDVGAGALQLAGDIGLAAITGGGSIAPMVARSFGSATKQAENRGGSELDQLVYGGLTAGTTALVGKLSNVGGILSKAYGKGVLDNTLQKATSGAIGKLIKNGVISDKIATGIAAGAGEGLEEMLESTLSPLYQKITYDPNATWNAEQILYDGLVGAIVGGFAGGFGGGTNTNLPSSNAQNTAQTGANKVQNTIAPNLLTPTKSQTPQQATQPITNNIAPNLVKLPTLEQNAAEVKQTAPEVQINANSGVQSGLYIDDRTYKDVSSPKVKAFQYDNPELHQNFVQAAIGLKSQLQFTTKGERWALKDENGYFVGSDGVKRSTTKQIEFLHDDANLKYDLIGKAIDDIIADHGQENYAAAKKVELVLDDMLSNGYEAEGYNFPADEDYIAKKEAIKNNIDYRMTEDEWNALMSDENQPINNQLSTIFPENSLGAKLTTPKSTLPQAVGASSPQFAYQEKVNQQNSTQTAFTAEEQKIDGLRTEDNTHQVITDKNALAKSKERIDFDYEGEKADLPNKQDWDKFDTTTAQLILRKMTAEARKSGDYSETIKWNKMLESHKSSIAAALQANKQFSTAPENIIADSAETLFGENVRKMSDAEKKDIMKSVTDSAEALDNIKQGDTASTIALIKKLNKIRKTTGLFTSETSAQMSKNLEYAAKLEDGEAFLRDVAAQQIRNIAGDYQKTSTLNAVKSYRIMGMLSKVSTLLRNFTSNTIVDPIDSIAGNMVVPIDILLSKYTGTRAVPVDKSWLSDAKRKGSIDGFVKSAIQVGLDANVSDDTSKYETNSARTFKMTGNPIERFLSTWSKWENYGLQSTDEFAKGGISAESQRGIDKLKSKGLVAKDALTDRPMEIAKQRTLQNDGMLATAMLKGRDAANTIGIKDKQGGSFGVGDLALPFARVPANATAMTANYTPAGLVKAAFNLTKTIKQAHDGTLTADQQAKAVTDLGRALSGTAGVAMFTGLAIAGIIKVAGSDDKDKEALETAEGQRGTQFNISALGRWLSGDNTKWQSDDTLISLGFMEQLNGQMVMGSMIAEAYKDDETISFGDIANANATAIFQSVLELPAMSQLNELVNGYKYSESDKIGGKLADAAVGYGASQASSFVVPNIIGGVATGLDDTVRNTYSSKNPLIQAKDSILSKIPFARNTLPAKLDNFGNERKYTGDTALDILNANILPGQVGKYDTNAINQELFKLDGKYPARSAPSSVETFDKEYELTATEKDTFQKTYGQQTYKELDKLFKSSEYKSMTADDKTKAVAEIYSTATYNAKQTVIEARGELFIPNADVGNKIAKYQSAGITQRQAYNLSKTMATLTPETGEKEVSDYQRIKTIGGQGYTDTQAIALVGTLYTSKDKTSMLPYLTTSKHLLSLYLTNKDTEMISMTIPEMFSEKKVEYTLTDKEKTLFKNAYANYFNGRVTNVTSAEAIKKLRDKAYDAAKLAVINGR